MRKFTIAIAAAALLTAATTALIPAHAHEKHVVFSAGEPGDPKKPARTIRILMVDDGSETDMKFDPAVITVRRGEQIRFILENSGTESHEFMLATVAENRKHAEIMKIPSSADSIKYSGKCRASA